MLFCCIEIRFYLSDRKGLVGACYHINFNLFALSFRYIVSISQCNYFHYFVYGHLLRPNAYHIPWLIVSRCESAFVDQQTRVTVPKKLILGQPLRSAFKRSDHTGSQLKADPSAQVTSQDDDDVIHLLPACRPAVFLVKYMAYIIVI